MDHTLDRLSTGREHKSRDKMKATGSCDGLIRIGPGREWQYDGCLMPPLLLAKGPNRGIEFCPSQIQFHLASGPISLDTDRQSLYSIYPSTIEIHGPKEHPSSRPRSSPQFSYPRTLLSRGPNQLFFSELSCCSFFLPSTCPQIPPILHNE